MRTPAEQVALVRSYNDTLLGDDEELAEAESARSEALEIMRSPADALMTESIVMRRRRPVLAIRNGAADLVFPDPDDAGIWKKRLQDASGLLAPAIAAVGRIELTNHPDYSWIGTGWLVHERYLVTNRHVAEVFALRHANRFGFQRSADGEMVVSIDLLQEIGRADSLVFKVKAISYIEESPGLDMAFLEVEQIDGGTATPIRLPGGSTATMPFVATIGYPAYDSRVPEPDLMRQIYGDVFDKKRLAPGAITNVEQERLLHNCTTLGGNSGSAVIDLRTGEAVGLHFSGSFLRTNYAVPGSLVKKRLDALLAGRLAERRAPVHSTSPQRNSVTAPVATNKTPSNGGGNTRSITIPLVVTVSLGEPSPGAVTWLATPPRGSAPVVPNDDDDDLTEPETEATPADYANRDGYEKAFLGTNFTVDLPKVEQAADDILTFDGGQHVLRYEHFSVVMNKARRMCFFSAGNIDGARSKGSKRTAWRYDPRIPQAMQIMKECYGNPPKFSRGHMTRREDPAWGSTDAERQLGSDDTMHVTNATPQMQSFNAPIWLALEDYALQHAREDSQKISVFTGPFFDDAADPTMFGVRIPISFWKVIAFVHDQNGKLCATGYEMSQKENLEQPEFVFGNFVSPQLNLSTQIPIATIESKAGLSFGDLATFDPLNQEGPDQPRTPLLSPTQIRFI